MKRIPLFLLALALPLTAHADTPGVDLMDGQYYAIDSCRMVSGNCSSMLLNGPGQGTITMQTAIGEAVYTMIGSEYVTAVEGPLQQGDVGTMTVWGRLMVNGAVRLMPSRRVTSNDSPNATDHTLLVDARNNAVTITLPQAQYHAGRQIVIKKIDSGNVVTIAAASGGTIDGAASVSLASQWETITVEATPIGDLTAGFTTDEWSIVAH